MIESLWNWLNANFIIDWWMVFGFVAQGCFFARFVIQWIASEKRKRSYIPKAFWYFSLLGASLLFIYAVGRGDPVFTMGQGLAFVIYIRNLKLYQDVDKLYEEMEASKKREKEEKTSEESEEKEESSEEGEGKERD